VPKANSDPVALRRWRLGCLKVAVVFVLLGAGIAVAGFFTTSHDPQDLGGTQLYLVGGGIALAGVAIAAWADWLGRRNGVRIRPKPPSIVWPWSPKH
jgi:hypothetical protein